MTELNRIPALIAGGAMSLMLALPGYAEDTAQTPAPTEEATAVAPAMEVDADTVVATVNGEDITIGHVIAARLNLPEQYQALPNDVLLPGLIEQLIQQTVLSQAAGEMTRRAQVQLDNERRAIVATEKLDEVLQSAVDDEKIQAAYDAAYADAEPTTEWNASHILVETEDEAKALIEELDGGADFADLARQKSTGPSGPNGGELGWFGPGMMVEAFEATVQALEVGQISAPVQTQFGWHVVKLNDMREKGAPPLDEVRDELAAQLENDAIDAALAALMDAASIERTDTAGMDANVISDMSLLQ